MIGLAVNQTAHLNVVNADPGSGPAVPCKLLLQFLDSEGSVVKQSWIENLQRGKAKYFELGREEVPDSPRRVQIRAVVRYASEPQTGAPMGPGTIIPMFLGCTVVPTLEVFNNDTGQTVVALGEARPIPTPMPLPLAAKAPPTSITTALP